MLHTHQLHIVALTRKTSGRSLWIFQTAKLFRKLESTADRSNFIFFSFSPPTVRAVPYLRRLVAEARVLSRSVHVRFVVPRVTLGQVFLTDLSGFPCQHHAILPRHSSLSLSLIALKNVRNLFFRISEEHRKEKYFHVFLFSSF